MSQKSWISLESLASDILLDLGTTESPFLREFSTLVVPKGLNRSLRLASFCRPRPKKPQYLYCVDTKMAHFEGNHSYITAIQNETHSQGVAFQNIKNNSYKLRPSQGPRCFLLGASTLQPSLRSLEPPTFPAAIAAQEARAKGSPTGGGVRPAGPQGPRQQRELVQVGAALEGDGFTVKIFEKAKQNGGVFLGSLKRLKHCLLLFGDGY